MLHKKINFLSDKGISTHKKQHKISYWLKTHNLLNINLFFNNTTFVQYILISIQTNSKTMFNCLGKMVLHVKLFECFAPKAFVYKCLRVYTV